MIPQSQAGSRYCEILACQSKGRRILLPAVKRNLVTNCVPIKMNKARTVKLSLRKLFIAMLAVGPVSILPSPLLAVVPQGTTAPFTQTNGSGATWFGSGTTGTITSGDRAVLVWN